MNSPFTDSSRINVSNNFKVMKALNVLMVAKDI